MRRRLKKHSRSYDFNRPWSTRGAFRRACVIWLQHCSHKTRPDEREKKVAIWRKTYLVVSTQHDVDQPLTCSLIKQIQVKSQILGGREGLRLAVKLKTPVIRIGDEHDPYLRMNSNKPKTTSGMTCCDTFYEWLRNLICENCFALPFWRVLVSRNSTHTTK